VFLYSFCFLLHFIQFCRIINLTKEKNNNRILKLHSILTYAEFKFLGRYVVSQKKDL
jgi:hypothetical protein